MKICVDVEVNNKKKKNLWRERSLPAVTKGVQGKY